MKVFIAFLLATFVVGGMSLGRVPRTRAVIFALCCTLVGAAFLSLRAIQ